MQLGPATYDETSDSVTVNVPPTRSDILHSVDVIEDVVLSVTTIFSWRCPPP